jgi:CDP-glycerol glycerophosphotransferase (TagB/SpsB family)
VIVCGNPRIDEFATPSPDSSLARLGLDASRPLILWAPTFRIARSSRGRPGWSDSSRSTPFSMLAEQQELVDDLIGRTGVQIVLKPHPVDAAPPSFDFVCSISDADLVAADTTLYELLARASALITDYSSIWTDFIPLDRPIGFFCPDLSDYQEGRGFSLGTFNRGLPGPTLTTTEGFCEFIEEVLTQPGAWRVDRANAVEDLGIVTDIGATDRLMQELTTRFGWSS